ncbi:Zn(II)2Cys6 transcription factor [Ophiocordyceps sinensis CO18]|uniref:Zn(II)2Cys6 transcription factor n=1 Tax=Ophiocordyceps sinensis (strain Co18 / CGMCC 3.14243) TaxID=911162 RepID=T5ADB4_OPHSC|nr:Zn(II)2Cys6 transcription factor [Ophiocordyceps sinensis CO18]
MASASGAGTIAGVPAGYGRSCTNCSRAKCRCILRPHGADCERCHRLGKQCQQIAASRKRTSKRSTPSRAAQLEEKLQDLVSLLRATQQPGQPATDHDSLPSLLSPQSSPSRLDSLDAAGKPPSQAESLPTMTPVFGPNVHSTDDAPRAHPEPTPEQAEIYLAKFRDWLVHFPFPHLPPELTAKRLRMERPFLWMCIMNLTTLSISQIYSLRDRIREHISRNLVLNYHADMDYLLGLLAILAWANTNTGLGVKPWIIMFSQLAITIIYDMDLNKAPNDDQHHTVYSKVCIYGGPPPKPRTMEERRAVVGFWYTSSINAAFMGKMETFTWNSYMDSCLDVLERERECPRDEILVALVRIQLIAEEAQKLLRSDGNGHSSQGPTYIFKAGLLSRLGDLREGLPASLHSHYLVQMQIHHAEAQIHSVGIFTDQVIPVPMRTNSLFTCTKAATSWVKTFFAMPVSEVPALPFSFYVIWTQTMTVLYKLLVLDDTAWDKEILRNEVDISTLHSRFIDVFTEAIENYYPDTEDKSATPLSKTPKILRHKMSLWEPAISHFLGASLATPNSDTMSVTAMQSRMVADNPAMMEALSFDLGDLTWMTDVFGPGYL